MTRDYLELAACKATLGRLSSTELESCLSRALDEDGEVFSAQLVGEVCAHEAIDARAVFGRVLAELGLPIRSRRDAVLRLALEVARGIVSGSVEAGTGAKQIWDLTLCAVQAPLPELDTFVYAASEWDERPGDRRMFEDGIVAAARSLVERGTAGTWELRRDDR